ncbi:hypothetical protein [Streptosporangium sp. NBC_01756]|uniref:hypothetical protein n=1 Tax=Streptosporangium sp. NBC_01756 TaxID=2975950 RepID=UPI002DD9CF84|nr:hypothetical protein [Streptosporangium sp. NBC_01756]WSC84258.1 hypothetical protein OIE48_28210 [Streptosporangium sp. NBC_01756]
MNGYLVQPGDVKDPSCRLDHLLRSPGRRASMGWATHGHRALLARSGAIYREVAR